jgi:uncharacterized protein (DUF2141 family)
MKIKIVTYLIAAILVTALLFSCANQAPPSGGPADETPPELRESYPAHGQVNVSARAIVNISFSEWVNTSGVSGAVSVYPYFPGGVTVKASKNRLRVIPKTPWNDNTTYHIVIGTTFKDLHGNALVSPINVVFSTGAVLDSGRLDGAAVSLAPFTTLPKVALYVESEVWTDSSYFSRPNYIAQIDSSGNFSFTHLREGKYRVAAFYDTYRFGRLVAGDSCLTSPEQTITITKAEQSIRLYPAESKAKDTAQTADSLRASKTIETDSLRAGKKADSLSASKKIEQDTLPLKLKSYLPKGLTNLMPELRLIWSKPARVSLSLAVAADSAGSDSAAFYVAAAGKHSDTTLLAPAKRLKPGLTYRLSIPPQAVKDVNGNNAVVDTVKSGAAKENSLKNRRVKKGLAGDSAAKDSLSADIVGDSAVKNSISEDSGVVKDTAAKDSVKPNMIEVVIKTLPADSLCYRLHGVAECLEPHPKRKWVYTPKGRDEKFTAADSSGTFSFDSIPASKGTLLWFIDENGDNRLTKGMLVPWRAPERFFAVPDTIEAKARWEIENLQIKGCE